MDNTYFTEKEALETIKEVVDYYAVDYLEDIHQHGFNEDYYIIGTFKAKQALEEYGTFKAIEKVQEYERNAFGEVVTDLSNPEAVASILWYVIGEEVLFNVVGLYELEEYTIEETLVNVSNKVSELLESGNY